MSKKWLFILLVFFIVIGLVGFWYYRDTIFSKEVLKLEIFGSEQTKMGEEIEYTVIYKNSGNFALEKPKITFELPQHSLVEDNKLRLEQNIKDIYPGEEGFVKFKVRLLGKEGDLKTARAWLSYLPHNLSARYESETSFTTKINSVPITLTYDLPSKAEKGKEITYLLNYFSNIDYPLESLSIKVEPVTDFKFSLTEPPSLDNKEWKLKTLNKGEGGRIKISGVVNADAGRNLIFSSKIGLWQDGALVIFKEAFQEVQVIQPLISVSQQINGSANYIASPGEVLNYEIFLRNIGSTSFDNLFLLSRLDGQWLDLSTLESSQGQVRPNDNLIIFDARQIPSLQHLAPWQEAKISFKVKMKDSLPTGADQVIKNKVNLLDISQEFETKVGAKLELRQNVYRANQPGIENSGPVPPEINKTTTYIVVWRIKNYFNDVKNIKVKTSLPEGITLGDNIIPENEISNFSLDSKSREIVWFIDSLSPGYEKSLTFQVALTPNLTQKGTVANLIGQATISGEDQFTGAAIQSIAPAVNSRLPDDPANSGGGIVQ